MGLIKRIANAETNVKDAETVKNLYAREITKVLLIAIGCLLIGLAIGGLFF